jgi:hypothetical protein
MQKVESTGCRLKMPLRVAQHSPHSFTSILNREQSIEEKGRLSEQLCCG